MTLSMLNQAPMFIVTGVILLFITVVCIVFMVKSYRAGIKIGMDEVHLKRAITSSITFTILPSVSILLGVLALSGSLGIPLSWLRLSVIGSLQYELNVAEIASRSLGMEGLRISEMTPSAFGALGLIMTAGISFGAICTFFGLKKYIEKIRSKSNEKKSDEASPFAILVVAMFIGLCSAYIGSYIGLFVTSGYFYPLLTAGLSGLVMVFFEYLINQKKMEWLENFSVAASMLIAMIGVILVNYIMY